MNDTTLPGTVTPTPSAEPAIDKLAAALAKAQAAIKHAAKDSTNPHFRSRYADLASVWDACRDPLTSNGLSVLQPVSTTGDEVCVTTVLAHASGQYLKSRMSAKVALNNPQAMGSAITYLRRYMLAAIVGVASDDDDANSASPTKEPHAPPSPPPQAPRPQAGRQAAPAPAAGGGPGAALTPKQRVNVASAAIVSRLGKPPGEELIASIRAKYAEAGKPVPDDKVMAYVAELEAAVAGTP